MNSKRLTHFIIFLFIFEPALVFSYQALTHHWPNEIFFLSSLIGWLLAEVARALTEAFKELIRLLERQNALMERVLLLLDDERQREPPARR